MHYLLEIGAERRGIPSEAICRDRMHLWDYNWRKGGIYKDLQLASLRPCNEWGREVSRVISVRCTGDGQAEGGL